MKFGADDAVMTKLDRDCDNFAHLVGKPVVVDTIPLLCTGVRCTESGPPFKQGTVVALIFKSLPAAELVRPAEGPGGASSPNAD